MTNGTTDAVAGEWAGVLDLAGSPTLILATWPSDGAPTGSLDLPGRSSFRLPVLNLDWDKRRLRFDVAFQGGTLGFDGRLKDGWIEGTVHEGSHRGRLRLHRKVQLVPEDASGIVGTYRLPDGEMVLVGRRGDGAGKFLFYARGDRLVPLHPLSPTTLLSDLVETLTVVRHEMGAVSGLGWQAHGAAETFAPSIAPYREDEVQFHNGDVTLAGTLLSPFGPGPHPAIVIMHGSMPSERDFYRVFADHFARRGIAALIYDKRGSGASTAGPSTIAGRAEDALGGLRFLQERPDIDPRRIGLWGFSNSTWSLPWAAARSADVAFLIATGAVGVSGAASETHRRVWELREWGIADATLVDVRRAWTIVFAYVATGQWDDAWNEEWEALVARLRQDTALQAVPLAGYVRDNPDLSPVPPLISVQELRPMISEPSPDMGHDAVTDYERVTCPVLFIVGERDGNLPAEESAFRVTAALARAGNQDYTVEVIPGAGHSLNLLDPNLTGISSEEASMRLHGFRFTPGYLDRMTTWLLQRVQTAVQPGLFMTHLD